MVPTMKVTSAKQTDPGAHQVFHTAERDVIGLRDERLPGEPLMLPVMRGGAIVDELPDLDAIRARCRSRVDALPPEVRRIHDPAPWPVARSARLVELRERLLREGGHRTGVRVGA
jgi:nicotinate phosphoribosyltransferase